MSTTRLFGFLLGAEADHRILPSVRVGAYFELVALESPSSDQVINNEAYFEAYRFGVRGQWHIRPDRLLDPWIGATMGAFVTTGLPVLSDPVAEPVPGRWGGDVGLETGLDFHLGPVFTVGPVFMMVVPFGPVKQKADSTSAGVYYSVPYLPLLRLGATF